MDVLAMILRLSACLLVFAFATACAPEHRQTTNITGAMPRLEFRMQRASDGAFVTGQNYRGQVVALYFGYTHCPDICPATLTNLSDMLQRLGTRARKICVLFVTVDPRRDTIQTLRAYVRAFSPQVDGLLGDDDAIAALARRYRVAYGAEPRSRGGAYSVMHSDAVFFFDRDGRARLVATSTDDVSSLADDIDRLTR
jgi:protein SCO1